MPWTIGLVLRFMNTKPYRQDARAAAAGNGSAASPIRSGIPLLRGTSSEGGSVRGSPCDVLARLKLYFRFDPLLRLLRRQPRTRGDAGGSAKRPVERELVFRERNRQRAGKGRERSGEEAAREHLAPGKKSHQGIGPVRDRNYEAAAPIPQRAEEVPDTRWGNTAPARR